MRLMTRSNHPERVQVGLENSLVLLTLVDVLLAQPHHDAQRFDVEAVALGLRVNVADVVGDRLLLLFEPLDALDDRLELILGEAVGGLFVIFSGSGGGHRVLLAFQLREVSVAGRFSSKQACDHPRSAQDKSAKTAASVLLACFFECRLLRRRRVVLVFGAPFVKRHAVDDLAALVLGHRQALGVGRVLHPVGQAVAAETGQIHQVDVLHVGAAAEVLDQAAIDGGLEFRAGFFIGSHKRLRVLVKTKIEAITPSCHSASCHSANCHSAPGPFGLTATHRDFLESLYRTAVGAAHPSGCLPAHLPEPPASGRLIVLAAGKAGGSLIEVAEQHYLARMPKERLTGIAVTRHGYGRPTTHIPVVEAGHPVPDAAGLAGAERMMKFAQGAGADDLVLVLLSGGASANLIAPAAGITLEEKQATTRALLRSGANIGEINCVRKHLSRIKGGRLARLAYPARVVTLAL